MCSSIWFYLFLYLFCLITNVIVAAGEVDVDGNGDGNRQSVVSSAMHCVSAKKKNNRMLPHIIDIVIIARCYCYSIRNIMQRRIPTRDTSKRQVMPLGDCNNKNQNRHEKKWIAWNKRVQQIPYDFHAPWNRVDSSRIQSNRIGLEITFSNVNTFVAGANKVRNKFEGSSKISCKSNFKRLI